MEQTSRGRDFGKYGSEIYAAPNGVHLISSSAPQYDPIECATTFFLRGSIANKHDYDVMQMSTETFELFREAVEAYNAEFAGPPEYPPEFWRWAEFAMGVRPAGIFTDSNDTPCLARETPVFSDGWWHGYRMAIELPGLEPDYANIASADSWTPNPLRRDDE
ncbi:hypothetical protein GF380_02070 [Candidatus Uhrbacteria bacterium]|nr:hypothetical protein [Candidatus Uhrbacteria bacterium]